MTATLLERGYILLSSILSSDLCAAIERDLVADFGDGSRANPREGHVVREVLDVCPRAVDAVVHPEGLGAIRGYIGEDIRLEALAGIVSDRRRPFMQWHAHVGGIEQDRVKPELASMRLSHPRRVMVLAYPGGCEGDAGALMVMPRRLADPLAPPHAPSELSWPGAETIHAAPGSVLVADEAVYHAVMQRRIDGPRCIVGAYFVRTADRVLDLRAPSLDRIISDDPEIRRLLDP
ncbi:MAG: hypothetical protein HOV80_37655 [Polyangiaceae bacterium]|nr:hypothetical protein [Polyangiaceae bacterium]